MSVVMQISDHVVVLEYGRKISDGSPQSVRTDPRVIAAYLGVDDEEVEAVLTEVGDEDVIEQLDTGPDAAHGPGHIVLVSRRPGDRHGRPQRGRAGHGVEGRLEGRVRSMRALRAAASKPAVAGRRAGGQGKACRESRAAQPNRSRRRRSPTAKAPAAKPAAKAAGVEGRGVSNRLAAPRGGKADNLTRIKGIGTVNEKKLNDHGIFHFDQIAAWKKADVEAAEAYLAFDGRIAREEWVKQAKLLGQGKDTEFSRRVDAGKVATSHASGKTASAASGKTAATPAAGKRGGRK